MTTRKHAFYGILALVSLLGLAITQSAKANYIVTLQQVGSDVVATGSGAIDLTGLTFRFPAALSPLIIPSSPSPGIITGASSGNGAEWMGTISGPANFGSGGLKAADSGVGQLAGVSTSPSLNVVFVPLGYANDTLLSDSATYSNTTFSMLGVDTGTYEWMWGTGTDQNFTLQILGPTNVPDAGSTLSLLGFASLGLVALRRKLRC
jgi:VPDSG-CTERM motif